VEGALERWWRLGTIQVLAIVQVFVHARFFSALSLNSLLLPPQ
jgi:heme/copper-type cytochrome/quinol oxidase subunit 4